MEFPCPLFYIATKYKAATIANSRATTGRPYKNQKHKI